MAFHKNLRGNDLHAPSTELIENNTGSTLTKLTVVAFNGMGTVYPQVQVADPNIYRNFGVVQDDILTGKSGYITCLGFMFNIDTSPWLVGTVLYSTASGALSSTPLGTAVAVVTKQDAATGVMYVMAVTGIGGGGDEHSWDVDGNDGLDGSTNFLGTRDLVPLKFRTNNTQVGQFDTNGRLAIGTHDPASPLHIKSYPGFTGSGLQVDTFSLMSNSASSVPIYTVDIDQNTVVRIKFQVTARQADGTQRATFTRSGLFYRQGGNTQLQLGSLGWQSDF